MSTKYTCCGRIHSNFRFYECGKTAKFDREGKHYCGMHDPVTIAEKQAIKDAAWRSDMAARDTATKARLDKQAETERRADCYPQILEALQALLHSEWQDDEGDTRLEKARELSRKAIAKALGETK